MAGRAEETASGGLGFVSRRPDVKTKVIRRRRDFDQLLEGPFTELRAISYVVSASTLLEFAKSRGYSKVEVLIGENLAADLKKDLAEKTLEIVKELAELTRTGKLRILLPSRTVHSKVYLLRGERTVRVIQTSANLTETAHRASRQVNYAWYFDAESDDRLLERLVADFEEHLKDSQLFMGDLLELLDKPGENTPETVIRNWLATAPEESEETVAAVQEAIETSVVAALNEQGLVTLSIPGGNGRRTVEKVIGPLGGNEGPDASVDVTGALTNLQTTIGLPYMTIHDDAVILAHAGNAIRRSSPPTQAREVDAAHANIEEYCNTAELGQSGDPLAVKTAFMEVILYVLTSPFFHLYMKAYRGAFGNVTMRGPRLLYVFGTSHNGKSTLLRYGLKLLTGVPVNALTGNDFKKTKIQNARLTGTVFPLAFDDVAFSSVSATADILKNYWENWWRPQHPSPQIIVTSNNPRLKEWAQSRVKRVDLYVHFPPNLKHKEKLSQLLGYDNRIFEWFSSLYLQRWKGAVGQEDELATARAVMLELYEFAGRPVPEFFPRESFEKTYDPGRESWRDLLYGLKKARMTRLRGRLKIDFDEDIPDPEVQAYRAQLPAAVSTTKTGRTLTIENPTEFLEWIGRKRQRGWFRRMFSREARRLSVKAGE